MFTFDTEFNDTFSAEVIVNSGFELDCIIVRVSYILQFFSQYVVLSKKLNINKTDSDLLWK